MRRSILASVVMLGLGCSPPKTAQNQTSVSNQKTTSAAVAWSPTVPCAVAVVGDHVETVCCAPKPGAATNEYACTVTPAPATSASPSAAPTMTTKKPCVCPPGVPTCNC